LQDEDVESDHEVEKMGKFVFDADDSTIDEIASGPTGVEQSF
jgi:hypothetical protein